MPSPPASPRVKRIAVIGTGIAGARCAQELARAGAHVRLHDKSRGVGGRLCTRRAEWAAGDGRLVSSRFDHGAPGFTARSPAFAHFVNEVCESGVLARWSPSLAPGSARSEARPAQWVPLPDMPSLCRHVLGKLPVALGSTVVALRRDPSGWTLQTAEHPAGEPVDAVVIAIPSVQAAPLLAPHAEDWSRRAAAWPVAPCWALMGVTEPGSAAPDWEAARPSHGSLAWIARNDLKPGRTPTDAPHWVAHASAEWSRAHLEDSPAQVQAALGEALAEWIGTPLRWRHVAVHRWRYASAVEAPDAPDSPHGTVPPAPFWWDASLGLGVCGDYLGGGGVEGAWCSGQALAEAMTDAGASARPGAHAA